MDIQLLNRVISELKPEIPGGIISNVHQMDERHIILKIFARGRDFRLLISVHPQFFRIHLTEKRYVNPPAPLRFCSYLRSHLVNQQIEDISVVEGERVVQILFKDFILIIELTGRDSNIILVDKNMVILDALRYFSQDKGYPRPVMSGLIYTPPPAGKKHSAGFNISLDNFSSCNRAVDVFYESPVDEERFTREKADLVRTVNDVKKRLERKLENLFEDRKKAEDNLKLQRYGELLLANFSKIKRGMKEVSVLDYYNEPPQEIIIPIDPALLPQENIDKIFKRVKKAKRAIELLKERMPSVEDEIKYLEDALFQIDALEEKDDVLAVREALISAGYIRANTERNKKEEIKTEPIRRFKSTDGCEILCGKTSTGNDLLLKKYARDYDLWFHAYGVAGSHVLLRFKEKNKEPSQNSIFEAGAIAVFFSKAKNSTKAEVAYTIARNVKKPKGAKPGLVTITNYKTIMVKIDENTVKRLTTSPVNP
ncbi:MAG: NFACT family protein [Deltaproteobacteria bacterium]|nr:NFACT family protein [Deltaproteobacteria bacterium]